MNMSMTTFIIMEPTREKLVAPLQMRGVVIDLFVDHHLGEQGLGPRWCSRSWGGSHVQSSYWLVCCCYYGDDGGNVALRLQGRVGVWPLFGVVVVVVVVAVVYVCNMP